MCHGKSFRIMKINSRNGKNRKIDEILLFVYVGNGFIKWNQHAIPKTRKYQCHVALSLIGETGATIWMHWWVSEQKSNRLHFTNQSGKSSHLNEPVFQYGTISMCIHHIGICSVAHLMRWKQNAKFIGLLVELCCVCVCVFMCDSVNWFVCFMTMMTVNSGGGGGKISSSSSSSRIAKSILIHWTEEYRALNLEVEHTIKWCLFGRALISPSSVLSHINYIFVRWVRFIIWTIQTERHWLGWRGD